MELNVIYSDGCFWAIENDDRGEYHAKIDTWVIVDKALEAEKDMVTIAYKPFRGRKWRNLSVRAYSIVALLPYVEEYLQNSNIVRIVAPKGIVNFYKG